MAKKYTHPKLPAQYNSYQNYFEREYKRRELERCFTYNVLTKRGNAWLWEMVGEGSTVTAEQKKEFFDDSVVIQVKNIKTKEPVYMIYVDKSFWYGSSKDRHDHDWIQSVANTHLDKLEGAIVKTKPKGK